MSTDRLNGVLRQIKKLIDEALRGAPSPSAKQKNRTLAKSVESHSANTLSDHILKLRHGAFLKQARTAKEVHLNLQDQYSCELNRVMMALLRLQRRKLLRKTTKIDGKKKTTAYVW